ncbi:Glyoxylate/succinic semialdehyde reductase 1 [Vitis vinifera]|uniref:Glyoxylate/succinic semialdehyde reductase 1 n=2 Tax=Vitis vinifera TaxID=29760 RepID=A0A438KR27_VITVI|nr:Glyoxylate/succinic semialdehyde reductase 1 [Vitis vinifera]
MEVGFLGLGIMGKAMSINLIRSGFKLTVWNRTLSKCDELVELGASIGETPAAVVKKCNYTIAMLSDPSVALSVVFDKDGVLEQICHGKGYIDMSTVGADTSSKISEMKSDGLWIEGASSPNRPFFQYKVELFLKNRRLLLWEKGNRKQFVCGFLLSAVCLSKPDGNGMPVDTEILARFEGTNSGCNIVNEVVDKKRRSNEDLKVHQEKSFGEYSFEHFTASLKYGWHVKQNRLVRVPSPSRYPIFPLLLMQSAVKTMLDDETLNPKKKQWNLRGFSVLVTVFPGERGERQLQERITIQPGHKGSFKGWAITSKGGSFLEAPVSGSKKPAEDGQLVILAAGEKALYDEAIPAFDIMGKKSFFLGQVGNGAKMKLVVNMIMGRKSHCGKVRYLLVSRLIWDVFDWCLDDSGKDMMNAFSEGLVLADRSGLNPHTLLDVLDLGGIANPMFRLKGPTMIQNNYSPAFPLKHQQKDMRLALALGDENAVSMPVAAAANEDLSFNGQSHPYGFEEGSNHMPAMASEYTTDV